MTTPARENEHAAARLAALKANLDARGIPTRLDTDSLAVLHPTSDEQLDTISVKRRPSDGDAWWYWDCVSPICEATDVIGAALIIVGNLRRTGTGA